MPLAFRSFELDEQDLASNGNRPPFDRAVAGIDDAAGDQPAVDHAEQAIDPSRVVADVDQQHTMIVLSRGEFGGNQHLTEERLLHIRNGEPQQLEHAGA